MQSEVLTPTVTNLTLTNADTEYSVSLSGVKHFTFQARTSVAVRFAFAADKVATPTAPYATLKAGQGFSSPEKLCGNITLYFGTNDAGTVIEIISWA